jgi:hypothetical protein
MDYDPRISALLRQTEQDWGNPFENRENIITYQTAPQFDAALYGVDLIDGELITIQAPKKQRKSTLLANWILHFIIQLRERDLWVCIDTLESGMTPKAYRDVIIAMLATRMMIGHVLDTNKRNEWPEVESIMNHQMLENELRISRKFLRFGERTEFQKTHIDNAITYLATTNLSIFGGTKDSGETRSLESTMDRWDKLYKGEHEEHEGRHIIFTADNVQQYREYAGNSYSGLELITNRFSEFVVSHPGAVVFAVSQVSLGSQRRANDTGEEMDARGGARLAEESTTVFQPFYDKDKDPYHMIIQTPYSRYEPPPTIIVDVEPNSGTFLRPGKPYYSR